MIIILIIISLIIIIIILVVDYHGWTRSADISMDLVPWAQLADTEAGGRRRSPTASDRHCVSSHPQVSSSSRWTV